MPEYTRYRNEGPHGLSKSCVHMTLQTFEAVAQHMLQQVQAESAPVRSPLSTLLYLSSFALVRYRPITHYFVAPGVSQFCEDCVKEIAPDYYKRLPEVKTYPLPGKLDPPAKTPEDVGGILFHFPVQENRRSLIVIYPEHRKPFLVREPNKDDPQGYESFCMVSDGRESVFVPTRKTTSNEAQPTHTEKIVKTVLGLSLYIDAFPDAVRPADHGPVPAHEGPPKTFLSIGAVPQVQHETANSRSPHYRRGHFRCLASDRFVHKRGLTIWIDGFFVGGTALDVCDDTPKQGD